VKKFTRKQLLKRVGELQALTLSKNLDKLYKVVVMGCIGICEMSDADLILKYYELTGGDECIIIKSNKL